MRELASSCASVSFTASVLLAISACGSDRLTAEQAGHAFVATSMALGAAQAEAEASVDQDVVSATASCTGGGSTSLEGSWQADSFALDVALDGCTEAGITMDGELHYSGSIGVGAATSSVLGLLVYSGSVSGSCDIELHVSASESSVLVQGHICGQDIDSGVSASHVDNPAQAPL